MMAGVSKWWSPSKLFKLSTTRPQSKNSSPLTQLPNHWQALYERGDVAFEVPIEKCVSLHHFSYGPNGWHPFVAALQQYDANPQLTFDRSVLHAFYRAYQPPNVLAAYLGHLPDYEHYQDAPLAKLSITSHHPFFPWDAAPRKAKSEWPFGVSDGHQCFGPVSSVKGRHELNRLKYCYDKIKREGYRPAGGEDGDIRGFLLRTKDDYRFVVRQGLHRTPALSVLGYERVRVKFFLGLPRAIFLTDLPHWPQVARGFIAPDLAERIFLMFFEDDGTDKARRLGLLG